MSSTKNRTVILIDGRNMCFRHGWTHASLRSGKQATGMLYGCITGILRLARLHPGAAIVVVWDGAKAKESWRHGIAKDYKANRGKGEAPQFVKDMRSQIPLFYKFMELLGFKQLTVSKLEADDLIGILAYHVRTMVDKVLIYSTDRDFYQLIHKNVYVVRDQDKKLKCKPITRKQIKAEYGVEPKDWLKYRGLVGDKGDNILKPKGMGPKKALALLEVGADPSKPKGYDYAWIPSTFNPKDDWLRQDWPLIRLNYKLSKILRYVDTKKLDHKTCTEAHDLLKQIKCFDDILRSPLSKGKKVYEEMTKFLSRYDFVELMGRRKEIWSLK